jgi:hypothetical protein
LALLPCHLAGFHGAQCKKKITVGSIGGVDLTLKEKKVMRKSAIRLVVATILLVSGSLMPLNASISPLPVPPLPPAHGV